MTLSKEPILVVGAGIVGLAVARELLLRYPHLNITVLEKEATVGAHQTGHNSGVIHSGIYYPPGSQKAALCRAGIHLLNEFCDRRAIRRRICGKVIVATRPEELSRLEGLYERGVANHVPGLRILSSEKLREIEPAIFGVKALYLPDVAVVDFGQVAAALREEFQSMGGTISLHRKVKAIRRDKAGIKVQTEEQVYRGRYLVNCAGLHCDEIAALAGCELSVRIIPFRGSYYRLKPSWAKKVRRLIYPVPDPALPFLGVHITPTVTGEVKVGPNAVLAFAREGYTWKKINLGDLGNMLGHGGFWHMARRHWRTGLAETVRSVFLPVYVAAIKEILPDLSASDLEPDGSGVRAQAVDQQGGLVDDFLYVEQPDAIHILNAPSPAATASLALAKRIVDLIPMAAP